MKWIFLALLIAPTAFADEVGVADCELKGSELTVSIVRLDRTTTARVSETANGDPIEFPKVKRESKKPAIFEATSFSLQVNLQDKGVKEDEDSNPAYHSHLSATKPDGSKIEQDLLCVVY